MCKSAREAFCVRVTFTLRSAHSYSSARVNNPEESNEGNKKNLHATKRMHGPNSENTAPFSLTHCEWETRRVSERERNSLCSSAAFCLFGLALFCAERARWARAILKSITFQTLVIASVCCYYHYHARRYPSERARCSASAPPQRRRLWRNRQPSRHANVLSLGRCANKNIIIAIIPSPFIAVHGCAFFFFIKLPNYANFSLGASSVFARSTACGVLFAFAWYASHWIAFVLCAA
jgi:hypothetical protein